ncbi:MAG: glycosyltransferase family 2 protein, partial [Clostridia bacterium]
MSDHKKVSVIIPVYQVENYLERAVDSVLEQTLSEMEIILVDDGSEDTSPQICDRYAREYPDRIRVIHKENEGLGMARNTGVRAAVGEYIAFLDSDDTVEPEMYEELYERAVEENYDMVMCDVKIIYVEEDRSVVVSTYSSEEIDLSDYIANGNNITYSVNKLYSRRIWEENQYEKMLFEDIALIPSLITKYQHIG